MTNINLKPCPFCGGRAVLLNAKRYPYGGDKYKCGFAVCCVKCNAEMFCEGYDSEELVAKAWNRRADERE